MKSIGYILIIVIALHAQCGADCLAAALDAKAQPPCHESESDPSSQHDEDAACGQTAGLNPRSDELAKWLVVHLLPVAEVVAVELFDLPVTPVFTATASIENSPPPRPLTLRI